MPDPPDNSERWGAAERLFHEALDQPAQTRIEFLNRACGADIEMRREVESLLRHHGVGDSLLERPAIAHAGWIAPAWTPGTVVGSYRIVERLGSGGMGEVFRARDTRLGRDVALKTVAPSQDPSYLERLRREARVLASLNHPNVATLYGIEESDGAFALAMELVEGETLTQRMAKGRMKPADFLAIAIEIAEAVEAAHRRDVIHRDLKPGNVMITRGGKAKVLDFGLAKRSKGVSGHPDDATQTAAPTNAGTVLGTVGYMSPEQAEGRDVDSRSDIFSFGTVLYEMLTGRRAFKGDTAARTLTAVLRDEPEPIELHAPGVSKELARIVRFCLRKDPERRYQSITDVKLALEEVQADGGAADSPPVVRRANGRWIVLASVVVAAATWYAVTRGSESQPPVVVTPLTMFSGLAESPAISPDGKMVAFGWDGDRGNLANIYVKAIGGGEPLRLTRNPARDTYPVWSPDGRTIAFSRSSGMPFALFNPAVVMIVPELGGAERRIGSGRVLDWSPDGSTLLVIRADPGEVSGHFLLSLRDGESRRLTTSPPGSTPSYARFSPDGRSVYYLENSSGRSRMFQIPVEGGTPKPVLPEFQYIEKFGWIGSGRETILTGLLQHSAVGFYRVPVSGGEARLLPFGAGGQVATSRLGSTVVFVKGESSHGIWRVGAWPGTDRQPVPWGTNGGTNWSLAFSADGSRAAFASNRSGRLQIWASQADGGEAVALTRFGIGEIGLVGSPTLSPDGSNVAFDCDMQPGRNRSICVVSTAGGAPRVLTTGTSDYVPAWSPDGRWIYFTSDRTGKSTIWRIPSAGGGAQQITKIGGYTPKISPDGKYLYYLKSQREGELWRAPVKGGVEERLLPEFKNRNFFVMPDGVYLLDSGPGANSLMRRRARARFYRFRTKQVEDLGFETEKPVIGHGISLSPDGKWLLYTQEDHDSANLMLVENFR